MKQGTQRVRKKTSPVSSVRVELVASQWRCEYDGEIVVDGYCASCELYNAAVHAQQMAAQHIATQKAPGSTGAWLNEYGVFARFRGTAVQVATPEEAAPFVALTSAARHAKGPFMPRQVSGIKKKSRSRK